MIIYRKGRRLLDVPVLGTSELLNTLRKEGINHAVNTLGGINNYQIRLHAFEKLESLHFQFPNLIHPSAVLEPSVKLDSGIQILAKTYISSDVEIDFGTLINAGVIVSHDCVIGRSTFPRRNARWKFISITTLRLEWAPRSICR